MIAQMKPFAPGHRFVKYDIRGLLGMGGHAHVYDAHDPFLDREVAVKVIAAPKGSRHNLAKRAQSEARVLVRIDHPNVVKVYDAGATDDGLVYLVMEKLEGRTLREVYQSLGQLTVVEALELARQICQGVHAAHELGVIHRDLKPENVFVQANNRVKVLDFGISKVMGYGAHDTTQRHVLHGTVLYMSPEHLQGYGVTRKSDVFALGTLLYEGLYAHPALLWPEARNAKDVREVIRIQLSETPPMLHELDSRIFRHVARFVHRAILKAAEQRYESMADMLEAAQAAWERLETEQGSDFMVQWRRDLSRATRAGALQPQRDTEHALMRFSTEFPPARTTQLGGLTPPLPLTSTRPVTDGLPYQTTTPVPGPDTPQRRSSPPMVVVPPLNGPSAVVTPLPGSFYSSSRIAPTPEQSATLALAEQVTRTAAVGIVDTPELPITPRSPEAGGGSGGLSVAPVSHSSMVSPGSLPLRAAGIPAPWFSRISARVVVAAGASLGLILGIVYSVAASRSPKPNEPPSVSAAMPEGDPVASPLVKPKPSKPVAKEAPAPANASPVPPGLAGSQVPASEESAPISNPQQASVGAPVGTSASATSTRNPSKPKAAAARASKKTNESARKPQRESWLKPEMIYYPDDPMPTPAKPPADRMPRSGLD